MTLILGYTSQSVKREMKTKEDIGMKYDPRYDDQSLLTLIPMMSLFVLVPFALVPFIPVLFNEVEIFQIENGET